MQSFEMLPSQSDFQRLQMAKSAHSLRNRCRLWRKTFEKVLFDLLPEVFPRLKHLYQISKRRQLQLLGNLSEFDQLAQVPICKVNSLGTDLRKPSFDMSTLCNSFRLETFAHSVEH